MTKFSRNRQLTFSDAVMDFKDRGPVTQSPQRNVENFIKRATISKKKWKQQSPLKVNKMVQNSTLEGGF